MSPAVKSEEKRMFSQATIDLSFLSILHFHSFLIWENNIDAQNVAMHMDVAIQGINRGFATDEFIPNVQFLILLRPEPMNELMGF